MVIGFGVGYLLGSRSAEKSAIASPYYLEPDKVKSYPTISKGLLGNSSRGPEYAKVTLIEVSDFQ